MSKSMTSTSIALTVAEKKRKAASRKAGSAARAPVLHVSIDELNAVTRAGQVYAARRQAARVISPELMARPVTV